MKRLIGWITDRFRSPFLYAPPGDEGRKNESDGIDRPPTTPDFLRQAMREQRERSIDEMEMVRFGGVLGRDDAPQGGAVRVGKGGEMSVAKDGCVTCPDCGTKWYSAGTEMHAPECTYYQSWLLTRRPSGNDQPKAARDR